MRLIDAQALLQEHCFCLSPNTKDYGSEWYKASCDECLKDGGFCGLEVSGDVIWNAPTVEAVPVVRCKDCKYYCKSLIDEVTNLPMCGVWSAPQKQDGFCNYGERMDEVENG